MSSLRIIGEPFLTLQGEGIYTGMPTTFLRMAGCNLRCTRRKGKGFNCDTPESLKDYNHKLKVFEEEGTGRNKGHSVALELLASDIRHLACRHVVYTGGEPTLQADDLSELSGLLVSMNPIITLETNGLIFDSILASFVDCVSLSPKLHEPAGDSGYSSQALMENLMDWITACPEAQVKIVVADKEDVDMALEMFMYLHQWFSTSFFLQPADDAINLHWEPQLARILYNSKPARDMGVRLSLQTHKMLEIE